MGNFFYGRLAGTNIRKNSRIYLPYILSCIFTVAMFYIMLFLSLNKGMSVMPGAQALTTIMALGSIVIGIFSAVILLYTNSFLMKRRKKELGLYNILGMGKNHIARVMTLETLYVGLGAIVAGLFIGILLSKLMLMLLLRMLRFNIPFGFEISPVAVGVTVVLFAAIFFVTLLVNLGRVRLSKPIELLYGGNVGEREPKTKWPLALIGFLALGAGYVIAIVTDNPIQALGWFFIAVLLVILGTYCLFTAGSIALLKALRGNKAYYYKTSHFTSVSGMIYRMKQNAVGLANICILSTMVLVMVSTTVSLYLGMEDALRSRFPRNIEITASHIGKAESLALEQKADDIVRQSGVPVENVVKYRYKASSMAYSGTVFSTGNGGGSASIATVFFIPLDEYNKLQGTSVTLQPRELLVYAPNTEYGGQYVSFGKETFSVKDVVQSLNVEDSYTLSLSDTFYFIVPDEQAVKDIYGTMTAGSGDWEELSYYYGFDTQAVDAVQTLLTSRLETALGTDGGGKGPYVYVASAEASRDSFLSLYGGLFFLGLFLGALFIMATVIIMYYKQVSEGYDDKKRFEIMQKVGLSRTEVKKAIRSQVLTVFFLPLVAAGIHILAAFKMITKLLFLLNLTNVPLFALCTLGTLVAFAAIYAVVYALTARAYYKIVS
ncbi:putative ABC transport system permease protein [Sporobacter termitidis DSM 10068]|uniref:Putative ABC transport system permease protein n=1 Tax=Sporobacter termitidis DSM 10068 TaxID=1123282 RepID=A0A1M5WFA9_9FIRM|nr:ABC transporter permease [Sporobacter termitidis]SHH86140.1 putative ABC transport system permease protein [Sporobacter termitidis DSM 10068]